MFVIFKNLVIDEIMNGFNLYSPGHKLTVLFWLLLINADFTMYLLFIFLFWKWFGCYQSQYYGYYYLGVLK